MPLTKGIVISRTISNDGEFNQVYAGMFEMAVDPQVKGLCQVW